jgi:4-amino-4-deoxy-L-arabinose transferase-like glycosyltransferase
MDESGPKSFAERATHVRVAFRTVRQVRPDLDSFARLAGLMKRVDAPRSARRRDPGGSPVWLAMFMTALALRVAYAWLAAGPGAAPHSDPATYDMVAWNLARGAGFAVDWGGETRPTAFVPPALPWLTSLLYRVAGHQFFAAILLQCVIGAFVPLLTAAVAGAMFGGAVARWSGWIAAVHPLLVFFSGYLLTETLFAATLLLALWLSVEWLKTPRAGRALGAGIAFGIATLARPTALTVPLVVALWAWRPLGLTVGASGRARQLAVLLLGLGLVVAPWTVRNALVLGAFVPVTSVSGITLLDSNNPRTLDEPALRGGADSDVRLAAQRRELRGLSEVETDARTRAMALSFLRERVPQWPAIAAAKLGRFWRVTSEAGGTGTWQRDGSPLAPLLRLDPLAAWSALTLPFAAWGLVRTLRGGRRWFQSLPLLVVIHFTLIAVVFFGSLRMRLPVEPLLAIFTALGADALHRRLRARSRGLTVMAGGNAAGVAS